MAGSITSLFFSKAQETSRVEKEPQKSSLVSPDGSFFPFRDFKENRDSLDHQKKRKMVVRHTFLRPLTQFTEQRFFSYDPSAQGKMNG